MAGALMLVIVVGIIVLLMLLFWIIGAYNRMVDLRNEVENQYQNLETQIGVKDQKIALVEETDLAQLGLESAVYDKIIDARKKFAEAKSSGNRGDMMAANGLLDSVIPQVLAFAEDNPQLTSHNVLVAGLEEGVQAIAKMANEVEEYNQAAKNYNTVTEMFPTLLVARMFGFERADLFDLYSKEQVDQMFDRKASLGSFVESKKSEADLRTEELKDEIAAIEAETELMKAKAELEALKEKMAEDE
ncbi:MAG TPA: LemA family protein [Candidatus Thalassarchaeaceae archaeon]|nr:LemA family protein [Candidatus Thalassarchaeaceae archaeon]DAC50594.1 MAG TPA: LemA family protein [Candidatus Poseidoniales archaeon]HIH82969.1 LemA family protein [Candidatus Thalassarchaeaceae archaeon]|tara:strand:- start:1906 stop:2640 length:735 start_codon:yes stop_codon:yes gene_type:complete